MAVVERTWPATAEVTRRLAALRSDVLDERRVDDDRWQACAADGDTPDDPGGAAELRFVQATGPFRSYERVVSRAGGQVTERTTYRLDIPWFGWFMAVPVRAVIGRRGGGRLAPWVAPPDRLDRRQVMVLGLLAAASMASAFVNTMFTQTVKFAADDFGVGDGGVGIAGSVVRAGIVLVLPFAAFADRIGRRPVIVATAFAAPLITALGALAPSFPLLVATQTVGRPLGLALDFMVAVVAAEEMPRSSRAYAISVLAMASGLGAGVAVGALPLADLSPSAWRYVYLVSLVWLAVAVSIARRLPETGRFHVHRDAVRRHAAASIEPTSERRGVLAVVDRRRFVVLASIAWLANMFVAPASLFHNSYLREVRGFSATGIAIFTFATATPAALGLVVGGRLADVRGRRRVIAIGPPLAAALVVLSFSIAGFGMWLATLAGAIVGGIAFPAMAVYRTELFPTGRRSWANALQTTAALLGGIVGLLTMGAVLDRGVSYGVVMGALATTQLLAVAIALANLPESAHQELEALNPSDATPA